MYSGQRMNYSCLSYTKAKNVQGLVRYHLKVHKRRPSSMYVRRTFASVWVSIVAAVRVPWDLCFERAIGKNS